MDASLNLEGGIHFVLEEGKGLSQNDFLKSFEAAALFSAEYEKGNK